MTARPAPLAIALASDHAGFEMKAMLADWLRMQGHAVSDLGPHDTASVDYPDYGYRLAQALAAGDASFGVAVCGSGIGISIGGGLCNVCLSYLAVSVASFSVTKAGDFIDASAASVTGELANRIRLAKEDSFYLNGATSDKIHQVLAVYYDDMIGSLVAALKQAFGDPRSLPKLGRAIPLVLSGGSVLPRGFKERFEIALKAADLPLQISEIRLAERPLETTAKGALVAALSEM